MYVESVPNRSSPPAVLLRESYRDGRRVKKRTLANLSKLPPAAIDMLRRVLRGEQLVNPDDAFTCVRSLPHGHVAAVLGTLKQLGLHTLIARGASRLRDLVVVLIVARVIDARSKLATARALTAESAVSTLGELLGLGDVDPHELYAAMDWLVERQAGIEQRLAKRHLRECRTNSTCRPSQPRFRRSIRCRTSGSRPTSGCSAYRRSGFCSPTTQGPARWS